MSESKKTVFVVGLGPGGGQFLTVQAQSALQQAEVLCGYTVYIDLVRPLRDGLPDEREPFRLREQPPARRPEVHHPGIAADHVHSRRLHPDGDVCAAVGTPRAHGPARDDGPYRQND
mgnify:CR=1 FL=1